jgi:hypothetical protein
MQFDSLAWLTTQFVLCRKSIDLSWEGEEPDTVASEKDSSAAAEESTPLPQVETMAPGTKATPSEATIVEGMYISMMSFASGSSRSPQ